MNPVAPEDEAPKPSQALDRNSRAMEVMHRYVHGEPLASIAKALSIAPRTAAKDLEKAKQYWRERSRTSYEEELLLKLAQIADLVHEARAAWQRSCEPTDANPDAKSPGDPRLLAELRKLLEFEAKLRGMLTDRAGQQDPQNQPVPQFVEVIVNNREEALQFSELKKRLENPKRTSSR